MFAGDAPSAVTPSANTPPLNTWDANATALTKEINVVSTVELTVYVRLSLVF